MGWQSQAPDRSKPMPEDVMPNRAQSRLPRIPFFAPIALSWIAASCAAPSPSQTPEYFNLRPEVERTYGYSHAVRIGNDIKVSGAVSMDDAGAPTAVGDLAQQMKNCYADLAKVLAHYGCSFDDVVVENIFTTDMAQFLACAEYRSTIYTTQSPTGSWLEVKGLALPEFMIEIELEVHQPGR